MQTLVEILLIFTLPDHNRHNDLFPLIKLELR